jgi:MFS family permease
VLDVKDMGFNGKEELKSTPLPWRQMLVICLVIFANFFAGNVIFPFVPFMIHDFFPTLPKSELGYYAGFLASAYHLGSFLGNPVVCPYFCLNN